MNLPPVGSKVTFTWEGTKRRGVITGRQGSEIFIRGREGPEIFPTVTIVIEDGTGKEFLFMDQDHDLTPVDAPVDATRGVTGSVEPGDPAGAFEAFREALRGHLHDEDELAEALTAFDACLNVARRLPPYMGQPLEVKPGVYRHYKGGLYVVTGCAVHHETRTPMVIYVSLEHGSVNVRPVFGTPQDPDGFSDYVGKNAYTDQVSRFLRVASATDQKLKDRNLL